MPCRLHSRQVVTAARADERPLLKYALATPGA